MHWPRLYAPVLARPRRAKRAAARRPSLLAAAYASALAFGLLSLAGVTALIWTSTSLQRAIGDVVRDTTSMAVASELELVLREYEQLNALVRAAPDPEVLAMRDRTLVEVRTLARQAPLHIGSERERPLLERAVADIEAYVREHERREASELEPGSNTRYAGPDFERAIASLEALRTLNELEVQQAHERALRLDELVNVAGTAVGALLVLALALVVLAIRRYVIGPLQSLLGTIRRRRAGDGGAVASASATREITEVAEAFNEMTAALARQRDDQLAFVAGVAHDLSSPLSALSMGVAVAEADASEANRARVLAMVGRQVGRLARMVQDLLDAARIEAGELELRVQTFDLAASVHDVVRLYEPTAPEHRFEVSVPDRPVTIEADPLRIEQSLGNLVSNAIKYSPAGGRVAVTLEATVREAALEVKDEGIGIPRERIPELFAPFRRLATDVARGAGLGLSVVRRIMEAHGGSIEVESEPDRGSTFRLRLPLAASPKK